MSQSRISRIETGKVLPAVVDVERILRALEVPADDARELLALARAANIEFRSARASARIGMWRRQYALKALTETTTVLRQFLPAIPTGLLQIPEYAEVAASATVPSAPDRDVARIVRARMELQKVLEDEHRQFVLLMTEQAVRWNYAGREVMARQVAHMMAAAGRSNVEIGVIPLAAEVHDAPMNMFVIHDDRLVTVELFNGGITFRDPRDIGHYRELFDFFWSHALTGSDVVDFLQVVATDFM